MARLSILIIENQPSDLRSLSEFLTHRDILVHSATDGPQGLAMAKDVHPNLILLSVELPTINGYIVCKNLKRNPDFAKTPLFLLSSTATQKDFELHQRLRIRAQEYFIKPYNPLDLWQRICLHLKIDPETLSQNHSSLPLSSQPTHTPPPNHMSKAPLFGSSPVPPPSDSEMFVDPTPSAREFFPEPKPHPSPASQSSTHIRPNPKLQRALQTTQQRLAAKEKRVAELEHALARQKRLHDQERETLELELKSHQHNLKSLEHQLQSTTREAHAQRSSLEQRLQQRTKEYEAMSAQHQRLSEQVRDLEQRAQATRTHIESLEANLKAAEETRDQLEKQATAAQNNASRAQSQAESLQAEVETLTREAQELQTQLTQSEQTVADLEVKIDSRKTSASSLEEQLAETRSQANSLEEQRALLEETLEKIRSVYKGDVKTLFTSINASHEAYGSSQENLQQLASYTTLLEDRLTSLSMVFGKLTNMLLNSARSLESNQALLALPEPPVLVDLPDSLHTPQLTSLPELELTDPPPTPSPQPSPEPEPAELPNIDDLLSTDGDISTAPLSWESTEDTDLHTVNDLELLALDDEDPLAGFAEDMAESLAAMDALSLDELDDVEEWGSEDQSGSDPLVSTSSSLPKPKPLAADSQFDLEVLSVAEDPNTGNPPPPPVSSPSASTAPPPPVDLDAFVAQVGKTLNATPSEDEDDLLSDLLDSSPASEDTPSS